MNEIETRSLHEWAASAPITNEMLSTAEASSVSIEDIRKECDAVMHQFRPPCPFNFLTQFDLWFEWHKLVHFDDTSQTRATLEIQFRELMMASMDAAIRAKEREAFPLMSVRFDPLPICSNVGPFTKNSV